VRWRLKAKALVAILTVVSAFLAASAFVTHRRVAREAERAKSAELDAEFRRYLREIDLFTDHQGTKAATLAALGELLYREKQANPTLDVRTSAMDRALANMRAVGDPAIIGSGLWFEPYSLDPGIRWIGSYAVADGQNEARPTWEYSNDDYAYTDHDWYQIAVPEAWDRSRPRERNLYMTEPYLDALGGRPTVFITFTHVMYSPNRRIIGVATADWTLDSLASTLRQFRATPSSFAFLVHERSGHVLFPASRERLQSVRDLPWGQSIDLHRAPARGIAHIGSVDVRGRAYDVRYSRSRAGFVFGLFVPRDEAYAALARIAYDDFALAILTLCFVALGTYWVVSKLLEPIHELAEAARAISAGDFGRSVPVSTDDEVGDLARAFNEAYRRVRASEERFRALIENATDIIAIIESDGSLSYASPAITRVLGMPSARVPGTAAEPLIHEDDRATWKKALDRLRRGESISELVEIRVRHIDGSFRTLEVMSTHLPETGPTPRVVVSARDVTERRQAETALKQSEEHLRQAQKLEAVGRLAGGIAHDFNNAMTAVLIHTELLLRKHEGDVRLCAELSEIRSAGEYASSLTRQLLTFSRRSVVEPDSVDVNEAVRDIERMLSRLIGEDLELETSLGTSLPRIFADRRHLEQVIVNLVVNARDAVQSGGRIRLTTRREFVDAPREAVNGTLEPGTYVVLVVDDTGTGMSAETLAHVFDPFFTTKGVGRGTGLGLSTVYGIVQESNGRIVLRSELGRGTTFSIYWPPTTRPVSAPAGEAETSAGDANSVIVIVEDDERVRSVTAAALRSAGYSIIEVEGPEAALARADEGMRFDLLLTDVVMPKMTGPELAQKLERMYPDMLVLFVSGYAAGELGNLEKLGERRAFLSKPFTPTQLNAAVGRLLAKRRNHAQHDEKAAG